MDSTSFAAEFSWNKVLDHNTATSVASRQVEESMVHVTAELKMPQPASGRHGGRYGCDVGGETTTPINCPEEFSVRSVNCTRETISSSRVRQLGSSLGGINDVRALHTLANIRVRGPLVVSGLHTDGRRTRGKSHQPPYM